MIYFLPLSLRYISGTVDLCVYTSDKHLVRSRFILIAPLCQRLLMSFYRTLHSPFHRCLFVLYVMACWNDLDTDQTAFHLREGTRDYTIRFEAEPILRKEKNLKPTSKKNMFLLFTCVNKLPCANVLMRNTGSLLSQTVRAH